MNNYIEHQTNYKVRYEKKTYGVVCDSNLFVALGIQKINCGNANTYNCFR